VPIPGDILSIGTGGWWTTIGAAAPAAPTGLTVVNDGDGDAVTATVTAVAEQQCLLVYRKLTEGSWTTGSSGTVGAGETTVEIAQAGLDDNTWYEFEAYAVAAGLVSVSVVPVRVYVTSGVAATGTGCISLPLVRMQSLIAACEAWQGWTGAADAAAALEYVRIVGVGDPEEWTSCDYPLALVWHGEDGIEHSDMDVTIHQEGELEIWVMDAVASVAQDYPNVAELAFTNQLGALLSEMREKAAESPGTYLVLRALDIDAPVQSSKLEDAARGRRYAVRLAAQWGP